MSVQSEIDRIHGNVQDTIAAIRQTGISVPSGANSDNLPALAEALANEKQDKLTGTEGQVVGFNEAGEAVAQDAPEGGITQEAADARYLQLTGGVLNGPLMMSAATPNIMLMTKAGVDKAMVSLNGSLIPEDGLHLVSVHPSGGGVVGLSVNPNGVTNNGKTALRLMVNNPQAGGSKMYNVIHEGNKDEYEYPPAGHTHNDYVSTDGDTMYHYLNVVTDAGSVSLTAEDFGPAIEMAGAFNVVGTDGVIAIGSLDLSNPLVGNVGFLMTKNRVEAIDLNPGITATASINMTNNQITNVANPTNSHDAATKAYVDAAAATTGGVKIETITYVGTGTYGSSNPCSVTTTFPAKLLIMLYEKYTNGYISLIFGSEFNGQCVMAADALKLAPDEYTKDLGFFTNVSGSGTIYGKISNDGLTWSWYSTGKAGAQFNDEGYVFCCLAIG